MKHTNWVQTGPGHVTNPLYPNVRWEDVAWSLANQPRHNGHMPRHMSIAEHCVRVAWEVERLTDSPDAVLQALLHDAAEAYCGDIVRPIKERAHGFKEIEHGIWQAIQARVGRDLGYDPWFIHHRIIKEVDNRALVYEVATAWGKDADPGWFELYGHPACEGSDEACNLTPCFWPPASASRRYLGLLDDLLRWERNT